MRIIIKLGGSILEDADIRGRLLGEIAHIVSLKHEVILVHGGGKSLNRRLAQMQMEARFIDGLRVTDEATLGAAIMTLSGEVNKKLAAELGSLGAAAIGLCGADAQSVRCVPVAGTPGYPEGIGFVGKPVKVNREFFELLLGAKITPVVSSIAIGMDDAAQFYNINADQMASACAVGVGSEALVYLTDVPGVMDANEKVIKELNRADILEMRAQGAISGGMLPKTTACLEALDSGIGAGAGAVYILPGADRNILTDFITGNLTKGTKIHEN